MSRQRKFRALRLAVRSLRSGHERMAPVGVTALARVAHGAVKGAMAGWAHARAEARGHGSAGRGVGRAEEMHQGFHTC